VLQSIHAAADSSPASGITEIFTGDEPSSNLRSNSTPDLLRKIGEFNAGGLGAENSGRRRAGMASPAGKTPPRMSPRRPPLRPRTNSAQLVAAVAAP